jgi:hypothetical protein
MKALPQEHRASDPIEAQNDRSLEVTWLFPGERPRIRPWVWLRRARGELNRSIPRAQGSR